MLVSCMQKNCWKFFSVEYVQQTELCTTNCSNLLCTVLSKIYPTPKNSQQFFCMQETNILSNHFMQLLYSLMMGQLVQKQTGVSGFYNIIVNLTQLYAFAGLNYSN